MKVSYSFEGYKSKLPVEGCSEQSPQQIRSMTDKQLCEMAVAAELFWSGCCRDVDMPCEIEVTETVLGE